MYYSSGYGVYSNPYYASSPTTSGTYLDYSAPMQVAADPENATGAADAPPSPEVQAALGTFDEARDAFKAQDYAKALAKTEEVLKKLPTDAAIHEFRALVLFALQRYKESAATIYSVLSVGPGWDWTTLSGMYGDDVEPYTRQLRALEDYARQHPESPDAPFVLAYHYTTCGHNEVAAKELRLVIKLLPNDQLAPQLLKMVDASSTGTEAQPPPADLGAKPALPPEDDGPPVERAKIVGTWKASRANVTIELALRNDGSFTWKATQSGRPATIEGKYQVEGNLLELKQTSDGNAMVGRVRVADRPGFNFKLVGSGTSDPGLDFAK
jgi:predicted negative regulator of RcsB-dependent stress response